MDAPPIVRVKIGDASQVLRFASPSDAVLHLLPLCTRVQLQELKLTLASAVQRPMPRVLEELTEVIVHGGE
jgi:hypothetical protein